MTQVPPFLVPTKAITAGFQSSNQVWINQSIKRIVNTINANEGGNVVIEGGGSVTFSANAFKDQSYNDYQGSVQVYTYYLDPTRQDIAEVMPGNLLAIDSQDELQTLKSFGMINVELEDENGNALQISQPATVKIITSAGAGTNFTS